jgi:hypothetical protein
MRRAREKEADSVARAYTNLFVVFSLLLLFSCLGLSYGIYYKRAIGFVTVVWVNCKSSTV